MSTSFQLSPTIVPQAPALPEPRAAIQLATHLIRELMMTEKILSVRPQWAPWMSYFIDFGVVHEEFGTHRPRWKLVEPWLEISPKDLVWQVAFRIPEYRTYLLDTVIGGLSRAAEEERWEELEAWTAKIPESLLVEINERFDDLDARKARKKRQALLEVVGDVQSDAVDHAPKDAGTEAGYEVKMSEDEYFASWNQVFFGRSGRQSATFYAVIDRMADMIGG